MTTQTETIETTTNPDVGDVDQFAKSQLEAPEGRFFLVLEGNYGMMQTKNGKPYLNALFRLDQEAIYGEDGMLINTVEITRRKTFFLKFFVDTEYGNASLNSFLSATIGKPPETFDQATQRYVYSKTEALNQALGKGAWNRIIHKNDPTYGWSIDLNRDWEKSPRKRIKATNGST